MKKSVNRLALVRETFRMLHELELTSVEGGADDRVVTGEARSCVAKARIDEPASSK